MSVTIANTSLNNSFNSWRLNTNYMATVISNNVVTVAGTGDTARGGMSRGSGHVEGTFSANTLKTFALAGGNTLVTTGFSIISNTFVTSANLHVYANTTFTGNVDFDISGSNRLTLGSIDRIRVTGGHTGQFVRISGVNGSEDTPNFKYLTLRDITDLSCNSAHIILSSANTSFSEDLNSPHLIFACGFGGSSPADKIHLFGAGDSLSGGDSDLFVKLADSGGDSKFTIASVSNSVVATISSAGRIDTVGALNVAGKSTFGELYANDNVWFFNTARFDGVTTFNDEVTFNGTVKLYGDVEVGDAAADQLNVEASSFLHGNTTLGDANSDILYVNAEIRSDLTPNTTNSFTLGKVDKKWKKVYVVDADFEDISVSGTARLNHTTVTSLYSNNEIRISGNAHLVDVYTSGDLDVTGETNLNGAVSLGDANTDLIYVRGQIDTHLIPSANTESDLGKHYKQWNSLWVGTANVASTLQVDGDAYLNDTTVTTLAANGDVDLRSNLGVDGISSLNQITATTITSNGVLTVGGRTFLTRQLNVSERTTLTSLHANGDFNVDGSSTVNALTTTSLHANGNFSVDGSSALNGTTTTSLHANGAFSVDGSSALNAATTTSLHANGAFSVDGTSALNAITATTIHANGAIDTDSNLTVDGSSALNGTTVTTLGANSAVHFKSTLDVDAATRLNSGIILGGSSTDNITVKGNFANQSTTGTADFNGTLNAYSTVNINDSVLFNGEVVGSHIIPSDDVTYDLGSATKAWRDLYLSGSSIKLGDIYLKEIGGEFAVTDASGNPLGANVSDLTASGTSSLNGITATTIHANSASTFANTVSVIGQSTLWKVAASGNTALSDRLDVAGNTALTGTLDVTGDATFNNLEAGDATITGQLNVTENAVISGNLYVAGTMTTINTETINLADNIIVLNSNLGPSTPATQNAGFLINRGSDADVSITWNETNDEWEFIDTKVTGTVHVTSNLSTNGNLEAIGGSDHTIGNDVGQGLVDETVKNSLWQSGDIATLHVYANTVFYDKVTISAPIISTGPGMFSRLIITGKSQLADKVTILDDLDVSGRTTLADLHANAAVDFTDDLDVSGVTTLWRINASGNTALGDRLDVTGNTELSGTLTVVGKSSVAAIDASGKATLSAVHANGVVDFTDNVTLGATDATTLVVNSKVDSDLIPKKTAGEAGPDIGSSGSKWDNVYANNVVLDSDATVGGELNVTGLIKSQSGLLTTPEAITTQYSQTPIDFLESDSFHITMTRNTELVLSNVGDKIGGYGSIVLIQDSTGGWEVTWPSEFKTPRGATIAQSTGASTMALLSYYIVAADTIIVNYLGDFQ